MNIAENILKHSLQNVYFLAGTAMGGKTTMSKELAKKYGFVHFNDNWHEDSFKVWLDITAQYGGTAFSINASNTPRSTKNQRRAWS